MIRNLFLIDNKSFHSQTMDFDNFFYFTSHKLNFVLFVPPCRWDYAVMSQPDHPYYPQIKLDLYELAWSNINVTSHGFAFQHFTPQYLLETCAGCVWLRSFSWYLPRPQQQSAVERENEFAYVYMRLLTQGSPYGKEFLPMTVDDIL